jgi:type I restriction enzyme S subunit
MDKVMMFQKAIHRVRPYNGIVPRYLLFHFWADARNGRLEKFFTGATIKHFTGKALADYPIALPPSAEQQRIVTKVDQLMRLCDALEAGLAQAETARRRATAAALQVV